MRRVVPGVLIVLALVLSAGCGAAEPAQEALAIVNGRTISLDQYQRGYREYLFRGGLPDEPTRRAAFLNRLIAVELIAAEARDSGIEATEEFVLAKDRARQKLLIEAYLADHVYSKIEITDNDLVDQFVRVNTQMTARHLRASGPEEAARLAERLKQGESFETLAAEVFADPVLATNGGLVGTFGFDEMDPAFEDAAFRLGVGEVSDPVRTSQGYSVIKLDDRFTKPVMTENEFAQSRAKLTGFVQARKQVDARRRFLDELLAEAGATVNAAEAVALLAADTEATEGDISRPVVTFALDGQPESWTLDELMAAAEFTSDRQRRAVDDEIDFRAFAEGLIARRLLLSKANALNLGRDSRVRAGLDAALSDWIYENAFNQIVENMELSDEDLRAYFEANSGEFVLPPKARVKEIVTASKADADELKGRLTASNFESIARRESLRPASAASGGDLGLFSRDELGPWGDQVFGAREGEILGPLPSAGKYLLLKVDAIESSRPATFEEARQQATALMRRERQQTYLREHVQMLRSRYPVRIVIDSLEEVPLSGPANA
ncbi:MAG: parvulin-like peptidyl-prolyl isomerase [Rhodothermales bacterium]|jgi:parvulin-like peptidyl-prolyl isomerase